MAKTKSQGPSRSDLIRRYIARHPNQGPKEIHAGMNAEGTNVTLSLVNAVKYKRVNVGAKARGAKAAASADGGPTKAEQIREVARSLGRPVRPRDVVARLHEQGVEVSRAQVSSVLRSMGMRRRPRRRRAKALAGAAPRVVKAEKWTLEDLVAAKRMAEQLGGIGKARDALAALSKLST